MTKTLRRARALIIDQTRVLLMHRIKGDQEYYTLCGGKLEPDETPEDGCIREVFEETSLHVTIEKELFRIDDILDGICNHHFVFLCSYNGGIAKLNGEEIDRMTEDNQYIPTWIKLTDLNTLPIKPDSIAKKLRIYLNRNRLA